MTAFNVEIASPGLVIGLVTVDEVIARLPNERDAAFVISMGRPAIRVSADGSAEAKALVARAIEDARRTDITITGVRVG